MTEDRAISLNAVLDVMHEMWGDSGELLDAIMELPPVTPSKQAIEEAYQAGLNEIEAYHLGYEEGQKENYLRGYIEGKKSMDFCDDAVSKGKALNAVHMSDDVYEAENKIRELPPVIP